ncbi:MAG: hypothetical protein EWV40_01675 [Microcystis flos-aquae Mf_WU_F_19750830_S460]|uniref:Uncharacterized protein n=1 Tax=Microcystis flos-aquae Mf_WU_F_19750830_S460 TaxID=2486237 RepID=A0A552M3V4_9CHRO|nr:MAG: hypothetical protein EWV40_01675 [Microcystis flos-aquae Mf_WU_F_19750830_S460]
MLFRLIVRNPQNGVICGNFRGSSRFCVISLTYIGSINLCVLCVFVVPSIPSLRRIYLRIHFTHQIQESRNLHKLHLKSICLTNHCTKPRVRLIISFKVDDNGSVQSPIDSVWVDATYLQ